MEVWDPVSGNFCGYYDDIPQAPTIPAHKPEPEEIHVEENESGRDGCNNISEIMPAIQWQGAWYPIHEKCREFGEITKETLLKLAAGF